MRPNGMLCNKIDCNTCIYDYELTECTLCNSGDIEDEYHVTLVCEQFADARKNTLKNSQKL